MLLSDQILQRHEKQTKVISLIW